MIGPNRRMQRTVQVGIRANDVGTSWMQACMVPGYAIPLLLLLEQTSTLPHPISQAILKHQPALKVVEHLLPLSPHPSSIPAIETHPPSTRPQNSKPQNHLQLCANPESTTPVTPLLRPMSAHILALTLPHLASVNRAEKTPYCCAALRLAFGPHCYCCLLDV